ncbi:4Fe-4S binding protein [Candidatus Woesearchaeota archaeon]|nr:4Fe-4S binding protein [Candidatus Woesearchaeota archaeon]
MPAIIDPDRCCLGNTDCSCGRCCEDCRCCIEACPVEAISKGDAIAVNPNRCIECGLCIDVCPKNAISIKKQ